MGEYGFLTSENVSVNKRELEDIVISAMRYALYRHTYVLDSTCYFVRVYAEELITERVYSVILHDVENRLKDWRANEDDMWRNDKIYIETFKDWLVKYGQEREYRSAWGEPSI